MVETRQQSAKNYNYLQDIKLNDYIDAKDTLNNWCVGQVHDINYETNMLKIHYEGWTAKYDEWIKKNSQKLAPFRRHSHGYTGQKKSAFRDFKINYHHQQSLLNKVKLITIQEFKDFFESAYQISQFIRGELYFEIDSLISIQQSTTQDDIPGIFDFIEEVFRMIIKWMEVFPRYLSIFNESQALPNLFLIDQDSAISQSGPELFNIFEKCFGQCNRCLRFMQSSITSQFIREGNYVTRDKMRQNSLMLSFVNAFGELGGFDAVLNFIKFESKDSKQKSLTNFMFIYRGKPYKACPLVLTMSALKPFVDVLQFAEKSFQLKFTESVRQALMDRLDNISDNEIKELDKEIIKDTIQVLSSYISISETKESAYMTAELYSLKIAQKYLRSPFFEKKVRGINDLKEIFFKVQNASTKSKTYLQDNNGNIEYTKWLTFEKYAKWIIDQKIVEFIFQEYPHVELIKRSEEILRLLAQSEATFSPQIIDMMWACTKEKHEDIVRATYDMIQELTYFLPIERLAQLFAKVQAIKESEFDEKTVMFLKNFTLNSMKNIRLNRKPEQRPSSSGMIFFKQSKPAPKMDDSKFYETSKFWCIFQEKNKVPQKVKDLALSSLIEVIQEINDKDIKESYISLSMDNIKRGDTFLNSIIFLRKILNTYPVDNNLRSQKQASTTLSISLILHEISKKNDIFDIVLKNTDVYIQSVNHKIKQNKIIKQASSNGSNNQVFVGSIVHEEFIKVIFNFIEFVLVNSKIALSYEHIEKMYQMFVSNAITEYETNQFFILITKENEQAKTRKFLLEDKTRNEVFQRIFCNDKQFNCDSINNFGFQCFKKLFLIVNEEDKTLEVSNENVQVNNLNSLVGMEVLWLICTQCLNSSVKENCRDFLVDLYLKAKTKSSAQKLQVRQRFIDKCLEKMQNSNSEYLLNCIRLVKTFIHRFDGDHILEEDILQYDVKELKQIPVTLSPDKITITVKAHPNQKLFQLKRKMAIQFKLKLSEFYIKTKAGALDDNLYNDAIREYNIKEVGVVRVPLEEMQREFPRYIIGNNKDYLHQFLNILKITNEQCAIEVLSLLDNLPYNPDFKDYIKNQINGFNSETLVEEWEKAMCWTKKADLSSTIYCLIGLEEMMIVNKNLVTTIEMQQIESQNKSEFCQKFLQRNGLAFLYEVYCSLGKADLERDILRTRTLSLVLKLILNLLSTKFQVLLKNYLSQIQTEKLMTQTLNIINSYVQTCYKQQSPTYEGKGSKNLRLLCNENSLFMDAFVFIQKALQLYPMNVLILYTFNGLEEILSIGLIELIYVEIRQIIQKSLSDICQLLDTNSFIQVKPAMFFMQKLNNMLEYALANEYNKTKNFFELINFIQVNTELYSALNQSEIAEVQARVLFLIKMIKKRDIIEISGVEEDCSLSGLFNVLRNILERIPYIRESLDKKNELLYYLIHDCLFDKDTKGQSNAKNRPMPPKCKNDYTRHTCLKLIKVLCLDNEKGVQVLIKYLKTYVNETFWRTQRKADWQIAVHQQERSQTGFVGLKNIHSICYMNSIMQQLFMIPTFRKAIIEVEDNSFESPEENSLHQLKLIFGGLMEVDKQYYNPKRFCQAFKELDGNPIDPKVQKDVDEFFIMLMDRIENLIGGKKEEKIIKNLFQGVFANEFICKGCPHYSEKEEPYLAISLQVKNKHSIKESLDAYVEGEMLEGDNAYYCEKCEKKVNTLKRCCIKRMPNVLFLVLKRFEFNFDTMSKSKVNDYCEFPMEINMSSYSQESLSKKDLQKEMEAKNLTFNDLNEEQKQVIDKQLPQKYYEYKLKGTVIHLGTADQGHYYSFIQEREGDSQQWYEFNDTTVKEFDKSDIPQEAFGGDDEQIMNDMQNMKQMGNDNAMLIAMKQFKTKIRNAYVLVYEREDIIDMEKFNECMDDPNIYTSKELIDQKYEQCKQSKPTSSQIQIPPFIHETIQQKNKKFWLSKFFFSKVFIDSILQTFKDITIQTDQDYEMARKVDLQSQMPGQLEIFKFFTTFFLTTGMRSRDRKCIPNFIKIIREALQKNIKLSVWLIETFTNQDIIREFLIDCPVPDLKRFVAGLLKTAMQSVYIYEQKLIMEYNNLGEVERVSYIQQTQGNLVQSIKTMDGKQAVKGDGVHSSCSELQLVTLSHHNDQMSVIIIMINSFIHLSASPHNIKNQHYCGQFYQLFAHFAELGDAARLYLLKTKSLGRMLDLFLNGDVPRQIAYFTSQNASISQSQSNIQSQQQLNNLQQLAAMSNKFKNIYLNNVPLFQLSKPFYLQSNAKRNDTPIQEMERKKIISDHQHPSKFLIYIISLLSRSCIYVKQQEKNPYSNDDINYVPDNDELTMIINHSDPKWWDNCVSKVSRNAIAQMYGHMSFESKDFSLSYLNTLFNLYNKATFDTVKCYERPMLKLFQLTDSYQLDRIKKAMPVFFEIMKNSIQYYKYTDALIEFIYKCVSRVPQMAELMSKNQAYYRQIDEWVKQNPHFPITQNRMKIFKQGIVQWNQKQGIVSQPILDKYAAYTKERHQKINRCLTKEHSQEQDYDSDDDVYNHKFQENERIDFCDSKDEWISGYVEIVLDEMVFCVKDPAPNTSNQSVWRETDGDKIAPANTYTNSEKFRNYLFYENLYKSVTN